MQSGLSIQDVPTRADVPLLRTRRSGPILALLALLSLARAAHADVVHLSDGRSIEGEIVRESETEIEVKIPFGSAIVPRDTIVSIDRKLAPEQVFRQQRAALKADDARGRVELARVALEKKFPRQTAAELAREAWAIDSGTEGAVDLLASLDWHFLDETWFDPDKYYARRGFLKREGKWVTPEELAYRDAIGATGLARDGVARAETALREGELLVTELPRVEAEAKARAEKVRSEVAALAVKHAAAKTTLDVRETDLKLASDKTIAARRDLTTLQLIPCPADEPGKLVYLDRIAAAEQNVRLSLHREHDARTARDAALAVVNDLAAAEAKGPERVRAAEAEVEAVRARAAEAQADLPRRRDAVQTAKAGLARAETAERDARAVVERRKLADLAQVKSEHDAARHWKKPADAKPEKR